MNFSYALGMHPSSNLLTICIPPLQGSAFSQSSPCVASSLLEPPRWSLCTASFSHAHVGRVHVRVHHVEPERDFSQALLRPQGATPLFLLCLGTERRGGEEGLGPLTMFFLFAQLQTS